MTRNCFSLQELQSKLALVDDKMNEISSVVLIENSEEALSSLSSIRLSVLGKKGILPSLLSLLPLLSEEDRPIGGKLINDAKRAITGVLDNVERDLKVNLVNSRMSEDFIDVTLPPRVPSVGSFHPVLEVLDRAIDVLLSMGFSVRYGSEVDTTENAFDVLNFSKFHPARDMQDTFYLQDGIVLRPQTSSAQIPILREGKLPIRVIVPGKCFRNEEISSRSLSVFHQVEGLYVDKDVTLGDLMSSLEVFYKSLLGENTVFRFRPSYFPFVEPGFEVDISCFLCSGKGCSMCKHSGWLEVAGAGMVHPTVLRNGGVNPEVYSGFAWGFGLERLVALLHKIPDLRLFIESKIKFLNQFR